MFTRMISKLISIVVLAGFGWLVLRYQPTNAATPAAPVREVPAAPVAQEPAGEMELPWDTASIPTSNLTWNEVMAAAPKLVNFVPGGPNGNPGPLIEWIDTRVGASKTEHVDTSPWTINGPALVWGGFHDAPSSYEIMSTTGVKVISAQGSKYRIGTSIIVVPAGTTITVHNTGAMVPLDGYDGTFPGAGPMVMQEEEVGFPLKCAATQNYPPRVIDLDALAESDQDTKAFARSHFNAEYKLETPSDMGFVLWTTGIVRGARLMGVDPGVAKIYFVNPGKTVTVLGSYQGVAVCAPAVSESAPQKGDDAHVSDAVQVPISEVAEMLNRGADLNALATKYPYAVIEGEFGEQPTASILLLGKGTDTTTWMTVGEGGVAPSVNLVPEATVPSGMKALLLDGSLDPECQLDYWMDAKPARCG